MRSLRVQLILFWAFLLAACALVAAIIVVLYQTGPGAQVAASQASATQACENIASRYAKSVPGVAADAPQADLLRVLLHVVLLEAPQVEGGVWSASANPPGGSMLAYAYPTYEGSSAKVDVPAAESPLIVETARQAGSTGRTAVNLVRGSREVLIVAAGPPCRCAGRHRHADRPARRAGAEPALAGAAAPPAAPHRGAGRLAAGAAGHGPPRRPGTPACRCRHAAPA